MKRVFDLTASLLLIIFLFPAFVVVSLFIVVDSRGKVFYRQKRVGKDGEVFEMFKFRSMVPNAEKLGAGLYFSGPDDPRITRMGRVLRRFSIDELPQLINVLKGDMSLIGPRPALVQHFKCFNEFQKKRLTVKPGITGWAQVNGRNNQSWSERIAYDIWYIENYSFRLDLLILVKTLQVVITGSGIRYDLTPEDMEDFTKIKEDGIGK